ncbi:MAG: hypothetical protein M3Z35_15505, partial [Nitrospirota bacterium]|nr:hypothetical protein [Nitrospirota bacterium]
DPARRLEVVIFWQGLKEHTWADGTALSSGADTPMRQDSSADMVRSDVIPVARPEAFDGEAESLHG